MNPPYRPFLARLSSAAPLAALVALFVLYRLAYDAAEIDRWPLAVPADALRATPPTAFPASVEIVLARISWAMTALLFVAAWAIAMVGAAQTLVDALSHRPAKVQRNALLGALGLGAVATAVTLGNPLTVGAVVDLLREGFGRLEIGHAQLLMNLFPALAVGAALLLLAAATACLSPRGDATPDARAEHLRCQLGRLRRVLYFGAGVLVAGTLQTAALHHLPVPLFIETADQVAMAKLAQGLSVATGSLWSLALLAIYLPAMLAIRQRSWRLAEAARGQEADVTTAEAWLEKHGLTSSWNAQVGRLAALLGPFLASGPAAALFEVLTMAG